MFPVDSVLRLDYVKSSAREIEMTTTRRILTVSVASQFGDFTQTVEIDTRYEKPAKVAKAVAKCVMGRVVSFTVV
jgi:hypothetical protein